MIAVRRFVIVCLLSVFCVAQVRAQSVRIEPKNKSGETTYIEQDMDVHQKMEGGPMPGAMEIDIKRVYGLNRKVEPTPDGGAKITMTFDRTMQKFDSPMMNGAYDSDAPDDDDSPMLAGPFKAMIGGTFTMEVDKEGQVKDFSGMKKILEKVEDASGGNPLSGQLRGELTDERGKSTYGEQLYLMYPNKDVSVGDTWAKTFHDVLPQLGKVISHYDYKLDRIAEENGHKVAIVSYKSTTEKDESAKSDDAMPGASTKVSGSGKGQLTYDVERGTVTKQTSDGHMNIEITRGNPGKKAKSADKKADEKSKGGKDDDDEDEDQPKPMKIDVTLKQSYSVMSTADRARQKTEAAARAKADQKKDDVKVDAKKKDAKKSAKKADDDDDD